MSPEHSRPPESGRGRFGDYLGGPWPWIVVALFAIAAVSLRFAVQPSTSTTAGGPASTAATSSVLDRPSSTVSASSTTSGTVPSTVPSSRATTPLENSGVWTMPDEIGNTLDSAKGDIDALTDGVAVEVAVNDVSGRGRRQIIHQHWQVCSQTPTAGDKFTPETGVSFGVVKTNETCPDNGA